MIGLACIAKQIKEKTLKKIFTNYASPVSLELVILLWFLLVSSSPCERLYTMWQKIEADT